MDKKVFQSSLDDLALKPRELPNSTLNNGNYQWSDGYSSSSSSGNNHHYQHPVYLTETFYITSKKNTVFQVRLTGNGLILRKEDCNGATKEQHILLRDIIGCRCLRSKKKRLKNGKVSSSCACSLPGSAQLKVVEANSGDQDESDSSAYLYIYAYIPKSHHSNHDSGAIENKSKSDNGKTKEEEIGRRDRTTITLRFRSFDTYEDNHQEAQKWRLTIKSLINKEIPSLQIPEATMATGVNTMAMVYAPRDTRKVLVIVNPKSGSGKARELFQQRVAPMLTEAELSYDLYVTKYANFARELVRTRDVFVWKSIVVVGGDGIYYEVLNGLCERPDWERALDEISIGIIPCGSGNGLAKTISHMAR